MEIEHLAVDWIEKRFLETEGVLYQEDFEKAKELQEAQLKSFYIQGGLDAVLGEDRSLDELICECSKK